MGTVKRFEDLEIWASARVICDDIFRTKQDTDLRSDFKLYNQLNGSSGSTMDNIAEDFERNGNREFIQFLAIAKASVEKQDLSYTEPLTESMLLSKSLTFFTTN